MDNHPDPNTGKPAKIPLTLNDVPPGSAIHVIGIERWAIITSADVKGIEVLGWSHFGWRDLMEGYEIKVPGGDWEPAYKLDQKF